MRKWWERPERREELVLRSDLDLAVRIAEEAVRAEEREGLADAWDEGYRAAQRDDLDNTETANPYVTSPRECGDGTCVCGGCVL